MSNTSNASEVQLNPSLKVAWGSWTASGALRWSKDGKLQQHFYRLGEYFKQMYGREYCREDEWRDVPTEGQS